MRTLVYVALFTMAAFPAAAQCSMVTSDLQYYVGTWSCIDGPQGHQTTKAAISYTLRSGILHETIDANVPRQGKITAFQDQELTTYDPQNHRFITAGLSKTPSQAMAFTTMSTLAGNVETFRDLWNSTGKPLHGKTVRNSSTMFTHIVYLNPNGSTPQWDTTCRRSTKR